MITQGLLRADATTATLTIGLKFFNTIVYPCCA